MLREILTDRWFIGACEIIQIRKLISYFFQHFCVKICLRSPHDFYDIKSIFLTQNARKADGSENIDSRG